MDKYSVMQIGLTLKILMIILEVKHLLKRLHGLIRNNLNLKVKILRSLQLIQDLYWEHLLLNANSNLQILWLEL